MAIDTLGYMKRLEAAGFDRKPSGREPEGKQAEALAEGLRDEVTPQLATKQDLDQLYHRIEALLWKHSLGVLLGVLAIGGVLIRFVR